MRDLGPAKMFIGFRITRDHERRLIFIDQGHYGRDVLDLYGMADCNPCLVPMNPTDHNLAKAREGEEGKEGKRQQWRDANADANARTVNVETV